MTENTQDQTNTNPLGKYYRQPQIYITLPTKGKYYPADAYTPSDTGEIPVFPMTAMDDGTCTKEEQSFKKRMCDQMEHSNCDSTGSQTKHHIAQL